MIALLQKLGLMPVVRRGQRVKATYSNDRWFIGRVLWTGYYPSSNTLFVRIKVEDGYEPYFNGGVLHFGFRPPCEGWMIPIPKKGRKEG